MNPIDGEPKKRVVCGLATYAVAEYRLEPTLLVLLLRLGCERLSLRSRPPVSRVHRTVSHLYPGDRNSHLQYEAYANPDVSFVGDELRPIQENGDLRTSHAPLTSRVYLTA